MQYTAAIVRAFESTRSRDATRNAVDATRWVRGDDGHKKPSTLSRRSIVPGRDSPITPTHDAHSIVPPGTRQKPS